MNAVYDANPIVPQHLCDYMELISKLGKLKQFSNGINIAVVFNNE